MGMRGPAPEPTAISNAKGTTRNRKNRRVKDEPQPPLGSPDVPRWLDEVSTAAWRELAPMLETMGVLTQVDENALARYCRLFARWRRMELFIDEHGETYESEGKDGTMFVRKRPQVGIASELASKLLQLEREFGLTPSARTRLRTTESIGVAADAASKRDRAAANSGAVIDKGQFFKVVG